MTAPSPSPHASMVSESPWRASLRRLRRDRLATGGAIFLAVLVLICVGFPLPHVSPYKESDQNLALKASPPSLAHWMGTDSLGRDITTRVCMGGRMSLLVGLVATLVAATIGVGYGLVSGMLGGRVDAVMMRIVDILYAFPFITLIIILTAVLGSRSGLVVDNIAGVDSQLFLLFAAIGAVEWLTMARVVRGQVLSLRNQEFILAARSYGARTPDILWRHLLPNVIGQVIVYSSLTVPGVMLLEATLSFLGLGVQPPSSSWGTLILDGANEMETSPWLLIFPGIFFSGTLLALNLFGDGLRDAFDPKAGR